MHIGKIRLSSPSYGLHTNVNGAYSTITFKWDDEKKVLTIGNRNGLFHGIPETRIDPSDKIIKYNWAEKKIIIM